MPIGTGFRCDRSPTTVASVHAAKTTRGWLLLTVVALLVASCGGSSSGDSDGTTPSTTAAVATSARSTTTSRPPPGRVSIAFAGDINFQGPRRQLLDANPGAILGPISPVLSAADLTVANLETALTQRGAPAPKAFTFRTKPAALDVLRSAGIDVASIANNHGLDYGPDGVPDALAASDQKDFPVIGIGENESQAMAGYRTTIDGNRIAVVAATQVLNDDLIPAWTATPDHPGLASAKRVEPLLARVRQVRRSADTVVVFLHWGIERNTCPSDVQRTLAAQLARAGADIIVGGHAHRVQGAGMLDNAVVDYGLGNFAFYAGSAEAATSGVLTVDIGGDEPPSYSWHPARIDGRGVPIPLSGSAADQAVAQWNDLRACTGLDP